ncbi:MAG: hypothetical protein LBG46_03305 [Elusimicrobiota bacterium]|nr:hypothetical protein [Elusimicrobiota bacterium]
MEKGKCRHTASQIKRYIFTHPKLAALEKLKAINSNNIANVLYVIICKTTLQKVIGRIYKPQVVILLAHDSIGDSRKPSNVLDTIAAALIAYCRNVEKGSWFLKDFIKKPA